MSLIEVNEDLAVYLGANKLHQKYWLKDFCDLIRPAAQGSVSRTKNRIKRRGHPASRCPRGSLLCEALLIDAAPLPGAGEVAALAGGTVALRSAVSRRAENLANRLAFSVRGRLVVGGHGHEQSKREKFPRFFHDAPPYERRVVVPVVNSSRRGFKVPTLSGGTSSFDAPAYSYRKIRANSILRELLPCSMDPRSAAEGFLKSQRFMGSWSWITGSPALSPTPPPAAPPPGPALPAAPSPPPPFSRDAGGNALRRSGAGASPRDAAPG